MGVVRTLTIAALVLLICGATPAQPRQPPSEYAIKAAFLVKFVDYVEWPSETGVEGRPFIVAVVGDDPFGVTLDSLLAGKRIHGRKLVARRYSSTDLAEVQGDVVFINARSEADVERITAALRDRAVLTVGDLTQFASHGGIIGFRMEGNLVRFDINVENASRARLVISSQLLKLARIVRGRS